MYIDVLYLFLSNRNMLRRILLSIILAIMLSGSDIFLFSQQVDENLTKNFNWLKKTLLKTLSFLPYYEYKPSINPSNTAEILLNELNICENIVDDHVQFNWETKEKIKIERRKGIKMLTLLFKKRKRSDPIEEKISDINYIRGLTMRYEAWYPRWVEKSDAAKEDLSFDEIDLLKYETKRISKKL